jgi:hypothetical protein
MTTADSQFFRTLHGEYAVHRSLHALPELQYLSLRAYKPLVLLL